MNERMLNENDSFGKQQHQQLLERRHGLLNWQRVNV